MDPKRIVLDTNVCLDLFVFHDPRCASLMAALRSGLAAAMTSVECRREWLCVLDYSHLPLDEEKKRQVISEFDSLVACISPEPRMTSLPQCSDPDDQKFLELARDARAQSLITKL